jgi:hypothetical protein
MKERPPKMPKPPGAESGGQGETDEDGCTISPIPEAASDDFLSAREELKFRRGISKN